MREYECNDIIRSINGQRIDLRKIVLLRTMSNLGIYIERTPETRHKEQAKILLNEITASSTHWIENEFLEITYSPKGEVGDLTTKSGSNSRSKPNPDGNVIVTGPWNGEQGAVGPTKTMPALLPHKHKVLNEKDKTILKNCLYEARESAGLCYDKFVKTAQEFTKHEVYIKSEIKKTLEKQTLNGENSRTLQNKIEAINNNVKLISSILTDITVNLPPDSFNSRTIISKLIELSKEHETKDIGEKLHSEFEEFKFYTILRNVLVKSDNPDSILQELINNRVQLTNCVKFFDNNVSTNRANGLLNTIINVLKRAE